MNGKRLLFLSLALVWGLPLHASTFVGNGGSAWETNVRASMKQIHQTMERIQKEQPDHICHCSNMASTRQSCKILRDLPKEKAEFCHAFILRHAKTLSDLAGGAEAVSVVLTEHSLEAGAGRPVQAVADRTRREILVREAAIERLASMETIALLTHELGHFLNLPDGEPLQDDSVVGPFKEPNGGRELLEMMGAAVALYGAQQKLIYDEYGSPSLSRAYKKNRVSYAAGKINLPGKARKQAFMKDGADFTGWSLAHVEGRWGVTLSYRSWKGEGTPLAGVRSRYEGSAISSGALFRTLPFAATDGYFSQMMLDLELGVLYGWHALQLEDDLVGESYGSRGRGLYGSFSVHFPVVNNFWIDLCWAHEGWNTQLGDIRLRPTEPMTSSSLGVSYAF